MPPEFFVAFVFCDIHIKHADHAYTEPKSLLEKIVDFTLEMRLTYVINDNKNNLVNLRRRPKRNNLAITAMIHKPSKITHIMNQFGLSPFDNEKLHEPDAWASLDCCRRY